MHHRRILQALSVIGVGVAAPVTLLAAGARIASAAEEIPITSCLGRAAICFTTTTCVQKDADGHCVVQETEYYRYNS